MNEPLTIEYRGDMMLTDTYTLDHSFRFSVMVQSAPKPRFVRIIANHLLSYDRQFKDDKDKWKAAMLTEGLGRLRALLADVGPEFFEDGGPYDLHLQPDNMPVDLDTRKRCELQVRTPRALTCVTGEQGSLELRPANITTRRVCAECAQPDDRLRCSHLTGVWTRGFRGGSNTMAREAFGTCELGYDVQPSTMNTGSADPTAAQRHISLCRLGGRECARVVIEPQAGPDPSEDVGDRLLRTIDYLNLVAKTELDIEKPMQLPDGETVAMLLKEAPTSADFTERRAALSTLLGQMRWPKSQRSGTISHLEDTLRQHKVDIPEDAIRNLRQIVDMRHGPPVHAAAEKASSAAAVLGIPFPVTDYQKTWRRMREVVADSLHRIAIAIKQRSKDGVETQ